MECAQGEQILVRGIGRVAADVAKCTSIGVATNGAVMNNGRQCAAGRQRVVIDKGRGSAPVGAVATFLAPLCEGFLTAFFIQLG